jgi:hypothetical protein
VAAFTDPDAAALLQERTVPARLREHQVALTRAGQASMQQGDLGSLMLLPLYLPRGSGQRTAAEIEATLVHEYTHFAQMSIVGSLSVPRWFMEGQAVFLEPRGGSRASSLLAAAAAAQRAGRAPRLADLTRHEDWTAAERVGRRNDLYARSYATMAFLVDRHGFGATVQLLRDSRYAGFDGFYVRLAALTGLDLDAFDTAAADWVLTQVPQLREHGTVGPPSAARPLLGPEDSSSPNGGWPVP